MGLLKDIFGQTKSPREEDSDLKALYEDYYGKRPKGRITDAEKDELLNFLEDEWEDDER